LKLKIAAINNKIEPTDLRKTDPRVSIVTSNVEKNIRTIKDQPRRKKSRKEVITSGLWVGHYRGNDGEFHESERPISGIANS